MTVLRDKVTGDAANIVAADDTGPFTGKNAILVVSAQEDAAHPVNLQDGAGNAITSTDEGGGVRALDVRIGQGGGGTPSLQRSTVIPDNQFVVPPGYRGMDAWAPEPAYQYPDIGRDEAGIPQLDASGSMIVRAVVHTDERSYGDDFSEALESVLTGTLSFTNGSTTVTGTGTAFLSEITAESYIRLSSDTQVKAKVVKRVLSDTELVLDEEYTGTTGSGAATHSKWRLWPGSGWNITQASSDVAISSGTTPSTMCHLLRVADYQPILCTFHVRLSGRDAQQLWGVGFRDCPGDAEAMFIFDGADPTKVKLRTGARNNDTQTTEYVLPNLGVTSDDHEYRIEIDSGHVSAWVDDIKIAVHHSHVPDPYAPMDVGIFGRNIGTPAGSTTIYCDSVFVENTNQATVKVKGELDKVRVRANGALRAEVIPYEWNIAKGTVADHTITQISTKISTSNTSRILVTTGVWNEQTSGAQRSIVSSNANDASGGTGVRKVLLTYIDTDGTQKFEVLTLSGTTPVNTVSTSIKWIVAMTTISAGNGGVAAGNISLYSAAGGGGVIMAQIVTGNRLLWSGTFYTPINRRAYFYKAIATSDASGIFTVERTTDFSLLGGDANMSLPGIEIPVDKTTSSAEVAGYPFPVDPGKKLQIYVKGVNGGNYWGTLFGWLENV